MIKRVLEVLPKWATASLLFFAQIQAQTDCFTSNECCNRFWGDAEFLYWKIQNSPESAPLVIRGPTLAVPPPVLGAPDTSIVLGGKDIDTGWRPGARATLGCWFDSSPCCGYGGEINYFFLSSESRKYTVTSDGSPTSPFLLVPFFNVFTLMEDSTAIASPLLQFRGTATLKLVNKMQGAELNILRPMPSCDSGSQLIALAGFRYWNFREHLTFTTNSPYNPPHAADTYTTKDLFSVENNFYGGQLGMIWAYDYGCLSLTAKGKIALGAMCERLAINGYLLTNDYDNFGVVIEYPGGYFALPTNMGRHTKTRFTAIPELNFDIGYQLFDCMQIKLGYTFIYVSNMLWAGKQIDRNINPTQATTYTNALPPVLEGQASPKAKMKWESLWVQGLQAGVEFSF